MTKVTQRVEHGDIKYYNEENFLHRDDGPAVIRKDGTKIWYQNGFIHREDGPASIYPDPEGSNRWMINGKLHREDGPAIIESGKKVWYLDNTLITFNNSAFYLMLKSSVCEEVADEVVNQVILPAFSPGLGLDSRHAEWLLENLEDARSLPSSWLREVLKGL